jgi:hypothetical protein
MLCKVLKLLKTKRLGNGASDENTVREAAPAVSLTYTRKNHLHRRDGLSKCPVYVIKESTQNVNVQQSSHCNTPHPSVTPLQHPTPSRRFLLKSLHIRTPRICKQYLFTFALILQSVTVNQNTQYAYQI